MKKQITILDVAQAAGVSKSTVSRVLNDGYVDASTRDKVEKAIAELHYTPNSFAQNMRTKKSKTVAMMIPDSTNSFYMECFREVEDVALSYGYMVILCDTKRSSENELMYAENLLRRNIDGLIYFTQERTPENEKFFVELARSIPVIFMDYAFSGIEGISCVATESVTPVVEAVTLLYNKGKRKIAFVNLPRHNNIVKSRCDAYRTGLTICGLEQDARLEYWCDVSESSLIEVGYIAAEELLSRAPDIDAIMTASDVLAVGVLKYLKDSSIAIPEEVAVVGFDDTVLCTVVEPALSTVVQPIEDMARVAATILFKKILEQPVEDDKVTFHGKLMLREST